MRPEDVRPVNDVAAAAWLAEALAPFEGTSQVRSVVPQGYERYIEIPLQHEKTLWTVRDRLATRTDASHACWFALWEGWPVPPSWRESPKFTTPEGNLLLFRGRFQDLDVVAVEFSCAAYALSTMECDLGPTGTAARLRAQRSHEPPSLWWPDDRDWVLAREVDSDCLYLAASDDLAEAVLTTVNLNARRVEASGQVHLET